jgi:pimeloyl-ACP methyl ester carboxylesterase
MNTSEFTTINNTRLEVQRIAGDPDLAAIVFLHEGLGSVAMWRDWPARVCAATGRRGLLYSRRGYGLSDANTDVRREQVSGADASRSASNPGAGALQADYMHREAFEVLPALLSALQLQRPILCGHSDGATISLLHASRFDCTAVVAMAPHLFVEPIALHAIAQAKLAFETGDLKSKLARYHADVHGAFWQWNGVWLSEAFKNFDITADCARISCPVLGIQGLQDAYGTMAQLDALQKCILQANLQKNNLMSGSNSHCSLLKLEHCGHSPHKDQADATLQAVTEFTN